MNNNKNENQRVLKSLLEEGNKLKKQGKLIEAENKYSEILKLKPNFVPAIDQLAGIYEQKKEYDKALHNLKHLLKFQQEKPVTWARLARAFTKLGSVQEGLENYKMALSLSSDLPAWVYDSLGDILYQKGQFDQAADSYQKLTELKKDTYPLAYKKLGDTLQYLGKIDEATAAYQKAISLQPENTEFSQALNGVEERYKIKSEFCGQLNSNPLIIGVKETIIVAAVTVIKNEEDIIYSNLLWHYSIGIKRFVILDNMSTDNTVKEVKRFAENYPNASLYLIEDREVGHYQSRKLSAAAEFAHRIWQSCWILPFDGDEILCSANSYLVEILSSLDKSISVIGLPLRNYLLRAFYNESETNPLRRMTHRRLNDQLDAKVMVRWKEGMTITQGNHYIRYEGKDILSQIQGQDVGLFLRHYPFRSRQHIEQKIRNKGRAYQAAPEISKAAGRKRRLWYEEYLDRGEEFINSFYKEQLNSFQESVFDPAII